MRIWKVILAACVIFGAGAVTGALSVRLKSQKPPVQQKTSSSHGVPRPYNTDFVDRMQRELDLTPPQRKRIEQILADSQDRVKKLCDPINDEFRKTRESIRGELTPEQLQKYDAIFRRRGKGREGKNGEDRRGSRQEGNAESRSASPSTNQNR